VACSRLSGHIRSSKHVYFTLQWSRIKLVRPLFTVDNTRDYARVSHSGQWSNYNITESLSVSWKKFHKYCALLIQILRKLVSLT